MNVAPSTRPSATAGDRIIVLFDVRIRHGFYNANAFRCLDFLVEPASASATLMAQLGMMFRAQADGFSVSIPQSRLPALRSHLAASAITDTPTPGVWSWLSFFLVAKNPNFIGITALPISTSPTRQCLHLSNLATHGVPPHLSFGAKGPVDPDCLYCVTGPSLAVQAPSGASVTLADLSGASIAQATADAQGSASLSFGRADFGYYTVAAERGACTPQAVVYSPPRPLASAMIDLVLTQPAPGIGDPASYPVMAVPDAVMPQRVDLTLAFQPRATFWRYYVVSQDPRGRFDSDLAITGDGMRFTKSHVALPNGDAAVLFAAGSALALRQHAPERFKLTGHRHGPNGAHDAVNVDRLPTAPPSPVWPAGGGDALTGTSEIFVYV